MTALQRGYIVGYADKLSLAAGETIRFMVSCEGAKTFKADLVRTVCGDPNPAAGGIREELIRTPLSGKTFKARKQEVYRGSCVRLHANPATEGLKSFSLQALIWPTTPAKGMQSIISKWSMANRGGYGLLIDAKGAVALGLGDGKGKADMISTGKRLLARHWYFVGASFDAETGEVRVYQEPLIEYGMAGDAGRARKKTTVRKLGDAGVPLLIGAWHERTVQRKEIMGGHFNGKIDSPRMANRALRRADMEALRGDAVPTRLRNALVAAWDFARDISSIRVSDLSVNAVHGEIVNMPARAMTGHNWTGREMCWRSAPEQYGAIHFHDDDLYDAGWEVDCELTLPKNLKSGIYAARLKAGETEDRVTFFVRPERGKATARAAVLMSTACYHAYANINALYWPTAELMSGRLINVHEDNLLLDEHPEWGASLYDSHSDGSGICYSSRLRPVLTMHTHASSAFGAHGSSLREFSADTRVVAWLDAEGIGYDILTDDDLDQEGIELLRPYKAIMTCSHPEYYSTRMWDAMRAYTDQGGRLMYLGGNGFYWRVAYHPEVPGMMEVRRGGPAIRAWAADPGETFHSFDGEHGGLWRNQGRAPQAITGVGFVSEGFDLCSHYVRTPASKDPRARFIFEGIGDKELIGDFGLEGGGAAGIEIDLADVKLGTPPHALVVASSVDHTESYLLVTEEADIMIPNVDATNNPRIRADLVFYETPNGGAVFSVGSIAWTGSLLWNKRNNNVSRLTGNVLRRFIKDEPF